MASNMSSKRTRGQAARRLTLALGPIGETAVDRESLRTYLAAAGVHPGLYSLDGPAHESESYSLVADGSGWSVLYKERGRFSTIAAGLSESEGCKLIYQLLDDALGLAAKAPAPGPSVQNGA